MAFRTIRHLTRNEAGERVVVIERQELRDDLTHDGPGTYTGAWSWALESGDSVTREGGVFYVDATGERLTLGR